MPQMLLPFFPVGVTQITPELAFKNENRTITYFNATMPVFHHSKDDIQSFKMIISQFYVMGVAKQADLVKAFGVNPLLVKRAVKLFREQGAQGFFQERKYRGAGVLTVEVLEQAQELLDQDMVPSEVAKRLNQKADTIRKAIKSGRLHRPASQVGRRNSRNGASSKSERSAEDGDAGMG